MFLYWNNNDSNEFQANFNFTPVTQIGTQSQQKNKTFPLFFHLTPKMSLATTYVKVFAGTFGLYGLQMLFTPAKMVTDHFETPATPMLKFWYVIVFGVLFITFELPIYY